MMETDDYRASNDAASDHDGEEWWSIGQVGSGMHVGSELGTVQPPSSLQVCEPAAAAAAAADAELRYWKLLIPNLPFSVLSRYHFLWVSEVAAAAWRGMSSTELTENKGFLDVPHTYVLCMFLLILTLTDGFFEGSTAGRVPALLTGSQWWSHVNKTNITVLVKMVHIDREHRSFWGMVIWLTLRCYYTFRDGKDLVN